MADDKEDGSGREAVDDYASPACFMHEVHPSYMGLPEPSPSVWRKAERERLIGSRMALAQEARAKASEDIARHLASFLGDVSVRRVSFYWPFRGEPDLRPFMETVWARGGQALLPIVVSKGRPLVFKAWRQGQPLGRGIWNIPIPAEGETIIPDIVIAPVVGYDPACYRLGYGGGFFDRTLAAMEIAPLVIGVGYASQKIPSIGPLPHDIPMSVIITEEGVERPNS